jgi:type IV pilus assembly protein PilA
VLALAALPIVGIMAMLAAIGVRQYIANAKTAEARNALGQMAKDAVAAYEASAEAGKPGRLCPSEKHPVPAAPTSVRGMKYQSKPAEWQSGAADSTIATATRRHPRVSSLAPKVISTETEYCQRLN